MKSYIIALLFLIINLQVLGQDNSADSTKNSPEIFMICEFPAEPIGGFTTLNKYFKENLKYPESALKRGFEEIVTVACILDTNGKVVNAEIIYGTNFDCNMEALRLARSMPNWKAGRQRKRAVYTRVKVHIVFQLPTKKE